MHIPDSIISPATSAVAAVAMVPVWTAAGKATRVLARDQSSALVGIGAAFSFTLMMFNLPALGGTTVHATGGVLLAILMGPWAAVVAMTVALAIQALFFGDGGILAIGANCFTMAFAMPFCGYGVYRLLAGSSPARSGRRAIAASIGAYVGINVAAILTAILLGIQPALHHDAAGHALYFPFDLRVALPAMAAPHLIVAGPAEAAVTLLVVLKLHTVGLAPYGCTGDRQQVGIRPIWVGLLALLALSPLGLLAGGSAWGEWSIEELGQRAGYVPSQARRVEASGPRAPAFLQDYAGEHGGPAYFGAGLLGVLITAGTSAAVVRAARGRGAVSTILPSPTVEMGQVPAWLSRGETAPEVPVMPTTGRPPRVALDRTLAEIAGATRDILFAERYARIPGHLQRLHPAAKAPALLAVIVAAASTHSLAAACALCAMAGLLSIATRIPVPLLLKRTAPALALFGLPMCLGLCVSRGAPHPLLTIVPAYQIGITAAGLQRALQVLLRLESVIAFTALLTLTTRWSDLLGALRRLRVPAPFIMIAAMAYRYLSVLNSLTIDLYQARRCRTVGNLPPLEARRLVASATATLFARSMALAHDVHLAMVARGWTGIDRPLEGPGATYRDIAGGVALAAAGIAVALLPAALHWP